MTLIKSDVVIDVAKVHCRVSALVRKMKGLPSLSNGRPGQLAGDSMLIAGVTFANPELTGTLTAAPPYFTAERTTWHVTTWADEGSFVVASRAFTTLPFDPPV